jgi:glycoside/pentoside/hexuronide:cation symporter, GPH family
VGAPSSNRRFTAVYGIAHGGKSLFWHAGELLFAYYLTEACGLSPRRMGQLLGWSLVLSAVADLAVGVGLRWRTRSLGDAARIQLLGATSSAAAFCAFGLSSFVPQGATRLAFACATLLAFRLTYALLDTPQNAMLALASTDDVARIRLSSVRYVFGGIANIVVAVAFAPLFNTGTATTQGANYFLFAFLLSVIGLASSYVLHRHVRTLGGNPVEEPRTRARENSVTAPIYRRWPIFIILFVMSLATSIFGRLEPYFAVYGVRSVLQGETLVISVAAGTLASQPFWAYVARRASLPRALQWSAASLVLVAPVLGAAIKSGFIGVALGAGLYGGCCSGVLMSLWALAAAASDRHVQPTVVFGAMTCVAKLALALAAFAVAQLLASTPYKIHAAASTCLLLTMIAAPFVAGLVALLLSAWINREHCA